MGGTDNRILNLSTATWFLPFLSTFFLPSHSFPLVTPFAALIMLVTFFLSAAIIHFVPSASSFNLLVGASISPSRCFARRAFTYPHHSLHSCGSSLRSSRSFSVLRFVIPIVIPAPHSLRN